MATKAHRLPGTVQPRSYALHIEASPDAPRFQGTARIAVELADGTQEVELHARDLDFTEVAAEQDGRIAGSARLDEGTETATLRFERPLRKGPAVLALAWSAAVSRGMTGLYLSKDGPELCLVTQCEATDARAIFPCFDEPASKATLQWTVTAPRGLTALANGALVSKREAQGKVAWEFAATPPISSYLAAIAIGRFASTPELTVAGVPFRTWAMAGKERLGTESRDAAARLLPWYEDYFGVPYRFGKYDQLAVPSFSFGAMENAGLVVFRASRLLMDKASAAWKDERDITLVVAHEFAHQWFGNHVTMAWWDDLWLNESFAEWVAHKAADALWPQHEVWLDFQRRTNGALATDALGATHPIYQPVATPAEAAELFDAITYGKGSAVLRMLEGFLGEEAFRAGLRSYMEEFGGANARGADLWRHLGRAASQPVERIVQGWVAQPGHPAVRVALQGDRLRLSQQRFRTKPGAAPGETTWEVPLVVRYEDDAGVHAVPHLLAAREGELTLALRGRLRWLHANAGDVGFYRADPDEALLARLAAHFDRLSPAERVGVLRDSWALVRSGSRPPERLFDLLGAALPKERHYAVVEEAEAVCREAERLLETAGEADALERYRAWVGRAFAPVLHAAGWDASRGEPPATGLLRAASYRGMAGIARDKAAVEHALAIAARERSRPPTVDPNLASTVVSLAAEFGDGARFDEHLSAYVARRDAKGPPQEADRYLDSFADFRAPALVGRALGLLEDGTVPKQSVGPLLREMLREPHAQLQALQHVTRRWPTLRKDLGDSWAASLAEATGFLPPRSRGEVERFLDAHATDFAQSAARAKGLLDEREAVFRQVVPALARWAERA